MKEEMFMKRKNKENKAALWIVIIFVVVLVASIFIQALAGNNNTQNNTNNTTNEEGTTDAGKNDEPSGDWKAALASDEKQLIYLGRPSCSWCNKLRPDLEDLKDRYDASFVYVNVDETSSDDQNTIFKQLDINASDFGTPYLVVIEGGKKVDEQVGYVPEEQLFQFLQKNGIIASDKKYE
jgi:predicted bacteriocin transport accessory protein